MKSILYPVFNSIIAPSSRWLAFLRTNTFPGRKSHLNISTRVLISLYLSLFSSRERFAVIGGGSLQILNLTEEDAGIYVCQADSGNMTSEIQAELTVHGTCQEQLRENTLISEMNRSSGSKHPRM